MPPDPAFELRWISRTPRLFVADGFATDDEVAHVLAAAASSADLMARGIPTRHDSTGFSFEMPVTGDDVLERITRRIAATVGLVNRFGQTLRFRRYAVGETHPPHLDCYAIGDLRLLATALLNLTDTAAGGETRFPRALPGPVEVRPRKGRLVVWCNHLPNGLEDPASFHEGSPVLDGGKVTITQFIYGPLTDAAVQIAGVRLDRPRGEPGCVLSV